MPEPDAAEAAELRVLSAGAAQGVVAALIPVLGATTGTRVRATFRAVGVLKEELLAGVPCDVLISTAAMLDDFVREGRIVAASIQSLGRVQTGIAIRSGEPAPVIGSGELLRACLVAAKGIHVPDPARATAGIHFVKVLRALGLHDDLASRLHAYPNGASAMDALAKSRESGLIGCTQITEINATPGVTLAGPLPAPFELATNYAGAVSTSARDPELARRFVRLLAGPDSLALRRGAGFEV
ncbi:MAG TPA: substrate-binding domain-containing protein [Casimicrobiaceae bacterium]|nr:substrate-binding domain-containing protein [Casimicrobiaceae bacterium]